MIGGRPSILKVLEHKVLKLVNDPSLAQSYMLGGKKEEERTMQYGNTKCQKMSGQAAGMGRIVSSLQVTFQEKSRNLSTIQ